MPDRHGIWTPRGTKSHSQRRFPFKPAVHEYTRPAALPVPKRTITSLEGDEEAAEALRVEIRNWTAAAERLEAKAGKETLSDKLARLMFKVNVPLKIKEQDAAWDRSGNGSITVGEFRVHVRELGVEATNEEIDRMFADWDLDRGGDIDTKELERALIRLREQFIKKYGKRGWHRPLLKQAELLRERAAAGTQALGATRKVEASEAELRALTDKLEGSLEVQLGIIIEKRKIRLGEVVGTWCRSRGQDAQSPRDGRSPRTAGYSMGRRSPRRSPRSPGRSPRRSSGGSGGGSSSSSSLLCLSRTEFKDAVQRLDIKVHGQPATRKALGALFDTVDTDKSGWLDLEEAKAALKRWTDEARERYAERAAKERELRRVKGFAARKLQTALRDPDSPGSLISAPAREGTSSPNGSPGGASASPGSPSDGDGGGSGAPWSFWGEGASWGEDNGGGWGLSSRLGGLGSGGPPGMTAIGREKLERKRRLEELQRQQRKKTIAKHAEKAVRRMVEQQLARGWQTWLASWEERCYVRSLIRGGIVGLLHAQIQRGWRQWKEWIEERTESLEVLARATANLAQRESARGYRHWVAGAAWLRQEREEEQRLRHTAAKMRNPRLVELFGRWQQEMRLAILALGLSPSSETEDGAGSSLCVAIARCWQTRGRRRLRLDPMEA